MRLHLQATSVPLVSIYNGALLFLWIRVEFCYRRSFGTFSRGIQGFAYRQRRGMTCPSCIRRWLFLWVFLSTPALLLRVCFFLWSNQSLPRYPPLEKVFMRYNGHYQ